MSIVSKSRTIQLNNGQVESQTLSECLKVDFYQLFCSQFSKPSSKTSLKLKAAGQLGIVKRMDAYASIVLESNGKEIISSLESSDSDTVRGWAAFAIGQLPNISLRQRFAHVQKLADDHHFGVREWAWLAIRKYVVAETTEAIKILSDWTSNDSPRIRRYASEATRPRGVWSEHVSFLKQKPETGLLILETLKSDPDKYVQDSVGNWLNDAAKSQPEWVKSVCDQWKSESNTQQTVYIVKKALRSIK